VPEIKSLLTGRPLESTAEIEDELQEIANKELQVAIDAFIDALSRYRVTADSEERLSEILIEVASQMLVDLRGCEQGSPEYESRRNLIARYASIACFAPLIEIDKINARDVLTH
jgi:hypothetical protein